MHTVTVELHKHTVIFSVSMACYYYESSECAHVNIHSIAKVASLPTREDADGGVPRLPISVLELTKNEGVGESSLAKIESK